MGPRPKEIVAKTPASFSSSSTPWSISSYSSAVLSEATRVAEAQKWGHMASDVASEVVVKFFSDPEGIMANYPDPIVFARAVTKTTGIDYRRKVAAQRGEGARQGRKVVSGDSSDDERSPYSESAEYAVADFADDVASRLDVAYRLEQIELGIPADEFEALYLTEVLGLTDAEAGHLVGVRRECINRRKNRAKSRLEGGAA